MQVRSIFHTKSAAKEGVLEEREVVESDWSQNVPSVS